MYKNALKLNNYWGFYPDAIRIRTTIFEAIATAPHLQRVDAFFYRRMTLPGWEIPERFLLSRVGKSTSLRSIHIHFSNRQALNEMLDWLQGKSYSTLVHCSLR